MGVWIDTDMGFDDLAAILTVGHAGLEIDGVSLTFGNAPMAQVAQNAAGAAQCFGWTFPIHCGSDRAILGAVETAQNILGNTGMPTVGLHLPEAELATSEPALQALCQWLENKNATHRILALGPLTNIATLCLARPDLAAKITDIVWMGGGATTGNHTASAEFNALADPEAAAIVLSRGIPFKMADLDFCRNVAIRQDDVDTLRQTTGKNAPVLADLLQGFLGIATARGRSEMAFFDPAAAVAFVDETLVTLEPVRIDMELSGSLTRGRTVVEKRGHKAAFNAFLIAEILEKNAHAMIMSALLNAARQ